MLQHASESLVDLAPALCAAQSEISSAFKNSTNPHFGSRYADLAAVWAACRDALSRHDLSVIQRPGADELETIILHKSGQWIGSLTPIVTSKPGPQAYGSAVSYARRYALSSMVGVVQTDDDAETAERRSAPARAESMTLDDARTKLEALTIEMSAERGDGRDRPRANVVADAARLQQTTPHLEDALGRHWDEFEITRAAARRRLEARQSARANGAPST